MSSAKWGERQFIAALSRAECDEWLLRLAQGQEANWSSCIS
jgi:hypothetical protein